jgi:hypothetical protein
MHGPWHFSPTFTCVQVTNGCLHPAHNNNNKSKRVLSIRVRAIKTAQLDTAHPTTRPLQAWNSERNTLHAYIRLHYSSNHKQHQANPTLIKATKNSAA